MKNEFDYIANFETGRVEKIVSRASGTWTEDDRRVPVQSKDFLFWEPWMPPVILTPALARQVNERIKQGREEKSKTKFKPYYTNKELTDVFSELGWETDRGSRTAALITGPFHGHRDFLGMRSYSQIHLSRKNKSVFINDFDDADLSYNGGDYEEMYERVIAGGIWSEKRLKKIGFEHD